MDYRRWLIVGYIAAMMLISVSILSIPATRGYDTLTTSDSGWLFDLSMDIENKGGLPEVNTLSRAPFGTRYESEQGQGVAAALLYRGAYALNSSVTMMDVVKAWGPLLFALSIIPVFLIGKELGGDIGGAAAAFFMATMVSTIYWNKVGAFDRECIQLLLGSWTMFTIIKLFKAPRRLKPQLAILAGLTYGIYGLTWSGSFYIIMIALGGLLFVLLLGFIGKLMKKISDPMKAVFSSVKSHLDSIIGVAVMMIAFTFVMWLVGGVPPQFWIGFMQSVLSYVGIGGGGGAISGGFASEEQLAGPLDETFKKFYSQPGDVPQILTGIVFMLFLVAIIKILWTRKPNDMLILAWLVVMLGLIWPGKGIARFERLWWPLLPALAGMGVATLASLLSQLSLDPSWDWLKKLQNPLLMVTVLVLFASPYVANAQQNAARTAPPTEWHGGGLDAGLQEAFTWINETTPDGSIVAIEWSFGHLMTGVTRRPSLVDGAGGDTGVDGTWQTENLEYSPPDYVLFPNETGGYDSPQSGIHYIYRPLTVNGRRPDSDRLTVTADENELIYLLKQYSSYGSKVDYIMFLRDANYYLRINSGIWSTAQNKEAPTASTTSGSNFELTFENKTVTLDASTWSAYVTEDGQQKYLEAVVLFDSQRETYFNVYPLRSDYQISEVVGVDLQTSQTPFSIRSIQVGQTVGKPMVYRVFANQDIPPFLSVVYTSSNGYVKVVEVDHTHDLLK